MQLSGAEQKAVARALRGIYTKKLIVSRQPIFTNLKSNTMKNDAKVWICMILDKFLPDFYTEIYTFLPLLWPDANRILRKYT